MLDMVVSAVVKWMHRESVNEWCHRSVVRPLIRRSCTTVEDMSSSHSGVRVTWPHELVQGRVNAVCVSTQLGTLRHAKSWSYLATNRLDIHLHLVFMENFLRRDSCVFKSDHRIILILCRPYIPCGPSYIGLSWFDPVRIFLAGFRRPNQEETVWSHIIATVALPQAPSPK